MYYPWLDVPVLTAPMLIAIIALLHVFVSYYAVGGGLLLALENDRSHRDGDVEYRAYLKKHTRFFVTLTLTYGAVTGVGIWFFIGLASPLATEVLIKTFVFGWAIEWCFFLLEIVSGLAFYFFWDKFSPRVSSFVGWTYAFSAWISLVLITGITSFMLNSGGLVADWESTGSFWHAFLNVQLAPQTIARTGCAFMLSSFYFLLHASLFAKNPSVRAKVTRHMRFPAFLGVFLLACGVVGWFFFLPESSLATLERASATNIFSGLFVAIIAAIVLVLMVGPVARPNETSAGVGLALALLGIAAVSVSEFVREAVRKPYIVNRVVYSNQIMRGDVKRMREEGLLYTGVWTNWLLDELQQKEEYQELDISSERYLNRSSNHVVRVTSGLEEKEDQKNDDAAPQPPNTTSNGADASLSYVEQTSALAQYSSGGAASFAPFATPQQRTNNDFSSQALNVGVDYQQAASSEPQNLSSSQPLVQPNIQVNHVVTASNLLDDVGSDVTDIGQLSESVDALVPSDLDEETNADILEAEQREQPTKLSVKELDVGLHGPIAYGNPDLLSLNEEDRLTLGRAVFMHHCNCCHAEKMGYSAISPLLAGRTVESIKELALHLNHVHYYMPPWAGTEVEATLLAEFLDTIKPEYPANVFQELKPKQKKNNIEKEQGTQEADEASSQDEVVSNGAAVGENASSGLSNEF